MIGRDLHCTADTPIDDAAIDRIGRGNLPLENETSAWRDAHIQMVALARAVAAVRDIWNRDRQTCEEQDALVQPPEALRRKARADVDVYDAEIGRVADGEGARSSALANVGGDDRRQGGVGGVSRRRVESEEIAAPDAHGGARHSAAKREYALAAELVRIDREQLLGVGVEDAVESRRVGLARKIEAIVTDAAEQGDLVVGGDFPAQQRCRKDVAAVVLRALRAAAVAETGV